MTPLPIDPFLPQIVARLKEQPAPRCLVLVAPPGAGKTTRVPPALLRAGLLTAEHPNLVMLQPRRVAARASAQRIAEENDWQLGREVGYHVRFDRKLTADTRIRVLTEGILTRQLLDDPFLPGVGAVLLDEFHERNLNTDVAIALLREVQQTVREDLILIVMSATLEAEPVAQFLGKCPIVRTEGRTYPVDVRYVAAATARPNEHLPERVVEAVGSALNATEDPGDVLVFLPGAEEIRRTLRRLDPLAAQHDLLVLPLHGSLPAEEQTLALRPASRRKVILATNIAETSLTIDGVRTVIDSGLARVAGYDPRRGLDKLELKRISKASATQRAGRAGRTAPGQCLRLWAEREQRFLPDFELPEIRRLDLCGTVLAMHAWGQSDPRKFGWFEPPAEEAIASAERLLEMLGALTAETNGKITPLGHRMLALPVHPRLARLLLAAAGAGLLREGATVAALLSEKDLLRSEVAPGGARGPREQGPSDLLLRLDLLARAEADRFSHALRDVGIDPIAARQVARTRDELLRISRRLPQGKLHGPADEALLKLPLWAYPDRVCRRRGGADRGVMVGGGGVKLAPESAVTRAEFFVALDARHDERSVTREALVRVASEVRVEWLEEMFPHELRRERDVVYDAERDRVVGRSLVRYRDLILHEDQNAALDPTLAARALAESAKPQAAEIFASHEGAANLLARVALLREKMPEHPWPKFDADELTDLLAEAAHGKRSIEELRRAPLAGLLTSRLQWPLDRLLEEHAPEAITVPTGSRIRVTYAIGQSPVLAVRLQELFGWTDTPRLAAGRAPVLLHLLGPNYRPVQITDDLRSFWSTTYFQVRKDLRVRYPKHSWPEDPLTAKPVAKGRSHQ
jgi:ATP-dependent helicase HrpB